MSKQKNITIDKKTLKLGIIESISHLYRETDAFSENRYCNQRTYEELSESDYDDITEDIWSFVNSNEPASEENLVYEKTIRLQNFRKRLESLINEFSLENESDTPDFLLSEYLVRCLSVFDEMLNKRETWYGRKSID